MYAFGSGRSRDTFVRLCGCALCVGNGQEQIKCKEEDEGKKQRNDEEEINKKDSFCKKE